MSEQTPETRYDSRSIISWPPISDLTPTLTSTTARLAERPTAHPLASVLDASSAFLYPIDLGIHGSIALRELAFLGPLSFRNLSKAEHLHPAPRSPRQLSHAPRPANRHVAVGHRSQVGDAVICMFQSAVRALLDLLDDVRTYAVHLATATAGADEVKLCGLYVTIGSSPESRRSWMASFPAFQLSCCCAPAVHQHRARLLRRRFRGGCQGQRRGVPKCYQVCHQTHTQSRGLFHRQIRRRSKQQFRLRPNVRCECPVGRVTGVRASYHATHGITNSKICLGARVDRCYHA